MALRWGILSTANITDKLLDSGTDQEFVAVGADEPMQEPVRVEKTPGRNEPCFCGSGKKYKLCHGR